jgi:hypothetical protein
MSCLPQEVDTSISASVEIPAELQRRDNIQDIKAKDVSAELAGI